MEFTMSVPKPPKQWLIRGFLCHAAMTTALCSHALFDINYLFPAACLTISSAFFIIAAFTWKPKIIEEDVELVSVTPALCREYPLNEGEPDIEVFECPECGEESWLDYVAPGRVEAIIIDCQICQHRFLLAVTTQL